MGLVEDKSTALFLLIIGKLVWLRESVGNSDRLAE